MVVCVAPPENVPPFASKITLGVFGVKNRYVVTFPLTILSVNAGVYEVPVLRAVPELLFVAYQPLKLYPVFAVAEIGRAHV